MKDFSRTKLWLCWDSTWDCLWQMPLLQRVKKLLAGRTSALASGQMLRLSTDFPASLCAFLQHIEGRELKYFPHAACFSSLPLFIAWKHLFIVHTLFCQSFQRLAIIISYNLDCYFVPMHDHNDFWHRYPAVLLIQHCFLSIILPVIHDSEMNMSKTLLLGHTASFLRLIRDKTARKFLLAYRKELVSYLPVIILFVKHIIFLPMRNGDVGDGIRDVFCMRRQCAETTHRLTVTYPWLFSCARAWNSHVGFCLCSAMHSKTTYSVICHPSVFFCLCILLWLLTHE